MKKFLTILILSISLTTSSNAGDIKDFQIEGMSVGDSALKFFSKKLIKESSKIVPTNTVDAKYYTTTIYSKSFGNYINVADFNFEVFDAVEISYKRQDKNFILKGVTGSITNEKKKNIKDIKDCKRQKDEIFNDVKLIFKNSMSKSDEGKHPIDKSGKSKYFRSSIQLKPTSKFMEIEAICLYFTGKITKDYVTNVGVSIKSDELNEWLHTLYK